MIKYNIYYKNDKINLKPLSIDELNHVYKEKIIYKKDKYNDDYKEIPVKNIKVIKVTII